MIGFITDENNDIMLDSIGNLKIADGVEAYRQNMVNRIRLQQYEYSYDLTRGINWMGYLLGNNVNIGMWQAQLLEMVSGLPYVKSIIDWKYNIENNNLQFRLIVDTDYGEIELKG